MRYFSEETVKEILHDVLPSFSGFDSIDLNNYPSFELDDNHGPLVDINKLKESFRTAVTDCEYTHKPERADYWRDAKALVDMAEVIVEAANDQGRSKEDI